MWRAANPASSCSQYSRATGHSVAASAAETLFEPFHQVGADPARSKGGLGLGLSVVKGLVELHGGSVQAFSDGPDRGSAFVVNLALDGGAS